MPDSLAAETARPEPGCQELLSENAVLVLVQCIRYTSEITLEQVALWDLGRVAVGVGAVLSEAARPQNL